MTGKLPLRIGTRGRPLALAQVKETRDRLCARHLDLAGTWGIMADDIVAGLYAGAVAFAVSLLFQS